MATPVLSTIAAACNFISEADIEDRFRAAASILHDVSLQNDDHGLMIASEEAWALIERGKHSTDVVFVKNAEGAVTKINYYELYESGPLAALAAEIALTEGSTNRQILLEAAVVELIRDDRWDAQTFAGKIAAVRRGEAPVEAVGIAFPLQLQEGEDEP